MITNTDIKIQITGLCLWTRDVRDTSVMYMVDITFRSSCMFVPVK